VGTLGAAKFRCLSIWDLFTINRSSINCVSLLDFRPPYLPTGLSIAVGENSAILTEPMVFQTPFGKRPDQFSPEKAQPLAHPIGWREITRVTVISPVQDRPSPAWQAVLDTQQVELEFGTEYWIELGFDGEVQGQRLDCRSQLPLVLCW
jgi:hypothetical protein